MRADGAGCKRRDVGTAGRGGEDRGMNAIGAGREGTATADREGEAVVLCCPGVGPAIARAGARGDPADLCALNAPRLAALLAPRAERARAIACCASMGEPGRRWADPGESAAAGGRAGRGASVAAARTKPPT